MSDKSKQGKEILIHIPHASLQLPKEVWLGGGYFDTHDWAEKMVAMDKATLEFYVKAMADEGLDRLFDNSIIGEDRLLESYRYALYNGNYSGSLSKLANNAYIVKPDYTRLFVDMERFADDGKEPMAKLGQGVVYTHTYDGKQILKAEYVDEKYRKLVLERSSYGYNAYHKVLKRYIEARSQHNEMIIVDLHSFGEDVLKHYPFYDKTKPTPDICLGYDEANCSLKLLEQCKAYFKKLGYSVAINYPYSGSFYPQDISPKNKVSSIMIELNKRIYLNDDKNFEKVSKEIQELILVLRGECTKQIAPLDLYKIDTSTAPKIYCGRSFVTATHPSFPKDTEACFDHVGDGSGYPYLYGDEASELHWQKENLEKREGNCRYYDTIKMSCFDEQAAIFGWIMEEAIKQDHKDIHGGIYAYLENAIRPHKDSIAKIYSDAQGNLTDEQKRLITEHQELIARMYRQCGIRKKQ